MEITQYYLTFPESNIVVLKTSIRNCSRTLLKPTYAYYVFTRPFGEKAEGFRKFSEGGETRWEYAGKTYDEPSHRSTAGVAAVYSRSGASVLVAPRSQSLSVGAMCFGPRHGCHLLLEYARPSRPLFPGQSVSFTAYLVIAEAGADPRPYYQLARLKI